MAHQSSAQPGFNPNLHGLRGIAALAVLLFHWGSDIGFFPEARRSWVVSEWDFGYVLDIGWLGVPLFFVLSGYLLTAQLQSRELTRSVVGRFWLRRFLRIYPAYWLQLAALLALGAALPFMPQVASVGDALRHVALWINLPPTMTRPFNAVWWTLPLELGFYLLLPGLVWLARRITWQAVVLTALGVTLFWRYQVMDYFAGQNYAAHLPVLDAIPGTLFTFCAGFGLAYLLVERQPLSPAWRALLLVLASTAFVALAQWLQANLATYWTGHWMLGVFNPLMAAVIAALLLALLWPLAGFRWLASRPLTWLGDTSYGIYLWHYPVLMLLDRTLLAHWNTPALALAALPVALLVTAVLAGLSYRYLEAPLMQLGRRGS